MSVKIVNNCFDSLKNDVLSYFDEDHSQIKFQVRPEQQMDEINSLKETVGNERFFFVVDLLNFEITEVYGMQKWLGYSEQQFSLEQYWNQLMHPGQRQTLLLIARQLYGSLCKGDYPLQFMVQRFASLIPLKHYDGHWVLAKKTASAFQYDDKNRLTAYLDEFTIIGDYDGEALNPRMYNSHGDKEVTKEKDILQKAMASFLKMKVFTLGELQTIRKLVYNPGITQSEIADEFALSVHTIETYYKRFLRKAREFFNVEFLTVMEAGVHLRKEGLL